MSGQWLVVRGRCDRPQTTGHSLGTGIEGPAEAAASALFVDDRGADGVMAAGDFGVGDTAPGGLAALLERDRQRHAVQVQAN